MMSTRIAVSGAAAVASWIILEHVGKLSSPGSRRNLLFMRAMFLVHALYSKLIVGDKREEENELSTTSPTNSLQESLFPPHLTAASVAACLIAKLHVFPSHVRNPASRVLVWILKLATPGLLWEAFAVTPDPIAESDPCALAAVSLAMALGGRSNVVITTLEDITTTEPPGHGATVMIAGSEDGDFVGVATLDCKKCKLAVGIHECPWKSMYVSMDAH